MIAFGRARVILVAGGLVLAGTWAGDDGPSSEAAAPVSTTTSTTSVPTTSTSAPGAESTTTTRRAPTTSTSAADGAPTTTTRRSTSTTGVIGPSTTTTEPSAPRCPTGGLGWDVRFDAQTTGDDLWSVTIGGTITSGADAPIDVVGISSFVAVTRDDGASATELVRADPSPRTVEVGARATYSSTAEMRSTTAPTYGGTTVERQWTDAAARGGCPPPT